MSPTVTDALLFTALPPLGMRDRAGNTTRTGASRKNSSGNSEDARDSPNRPSRSYCTTFVAKPKLAAVWLELHVTNRLLQSGHKDVMGLYF